MTGLSGQAAAAASVFIAAVVLLRLTPGPRGAIRRPRPPRRPAPPVRYSGDDYDALVAVGLLDLTCPPCPDPGNPGHDLRLTVDRLGVLGDKGRLILLARDPAQEGRAVAIPVPPGTPDPLTAAAWTYDTTPDVYADLARRT
jgi:hypothetical protein